MAWRIASSRSPCPHASGTAGANKGVASTKSRFSLGRASTTLASADAADGRVHFTPANLLTNPALDPVGKIAELKYCAVDVRPATVPA